MSANIYRLAQAGWRDQIDRIVDGGYYAVERRWENYFDEHIAPEWQSRLRLPSDEELAKSLNLTKTMLGLLHLAGRGYRRHGIDRKAPKFKCWPPHSEGKKDIRFYKAFPIADIAKLLGKSPSAVRMALSRFRGLQNDACAFRLHRLVGFPPVKSGILLDLVLLPQDGQLSFGYQYEEYRATKEWATQKGADDIYIRSYAHEWAHVAIANVAPNITQMRTAETETMDLFLAPIADGAGGGE